MKGSERSLARRAVGSLVRLVPLVLLLAAWEWVARRTDHGVFFFGSPTSIADRLRTRVADGSIFYDLGVTAAESLAGLTLGTALGTTLGVLLGYFPGAARIARPYVLSLSAVPVIAIAPVLVVWVGIGIGAKIVTATLATVFVAMFQAYEGVQRVDTLHVQLLRSMGATRPQLFYRLVLPSAFTWILAGARLNCGFAILGAFLGEFIASQRGLGWLIVYASGLFDVPLALAGVVVICGMTLTFTALIDILGRRLAPWVVVSRSVV